LLFYQEDCNIHNNILDCPRAASAKQGLQRNGGWHIVKKIGLVVKPDDKARQSAAELEAWLKERRVDVLRKDLHPHEKHDDEGSAMFAPEDLFCVFVLGGDGTFLGAARWIGNQNIPILGVKFGDVGFLAETTEDGLFEVAEAVLNNDYEIRARTRLEVGVFKGQKELTRDTVLNDIVINKGALARLAHIETYVDDYKLTTYKGDGLIVSTPTGSTAYSLAAGGPIIHPAVSGIIMTPICPFTLTNRPLILPDTAEIKIRLAEKSSDIMLTFDGQEGLEIDDQDVIVVKKSIHPIKIIVMPGRRYFDVLKAKLKWSGSRII